MKIITSKRGTFETRKLGKAGVLDLQSQIMAAATAPEGRVVTRVEINFEAETSRFFDSNGTESGCGLKVFTAPKRQFASRSLAGDALAKAMASGNIDAEATASERR